MALSGSAQVSKKRQSSMRSRRARATMPMALMRRPPWAKRRSNQRVSWEAGWKRRQPQAIWMGMARPGGLKAGALEGHELADHGDRGVGVVLELLGLETLDEADSLDDAVTV